MGTEILASYSRVNTHGTMGAAVSIRTLEFCTAMALHGYVTVGGSLDFSQPQIPSLQKKIALDNLLRCLPALMFCNSNEHSENGD